MQHVNFFRNLDTVVRELHARGHEVVLLHGTPLDTAEGKARFTKKKAKMVFMGRGIEVAQAEISVTVGYRSEPPERWQRLLRHGRRLINRGIYFRKGHPSPDRVTASLEKGWPPVVRACVNSRLSRWLLGRRQTLRLWRWLERASRPSATVVSLLEEIQPDVVIVSPTVWPKAPVEADYIRAARSLRIPTIGYLNSWDNLTSKGTVHVLPDAYVVWNEALAEEAVELHDIPRRSIHVTGAAHLDRIFELRPSASRGEICAHMGCPAERPYLVYLCSSRTLITDETELATALADALGTRFPGDAPTLVVRPHPTNPNPWEGFAHPGAVVFPKLGDQADSPDSWQEYYDQLSQAACVFGLNTTAFLEAVAVDRPCLTLVADEFHAVQGKTGHFRHLLEADFLEVSSDVDEVADRVARVLGGADEKAAGRHFFTEWFLRPGGVDVPTTPALVDKIEAMGSGVRFQHPLAGGSGVEEPLVRLARDER